MRPLSNIATGDEDDKTFSLDDLGPGECSGTVIDMIEYGLRMASETIVKAIAGRGS